MTVFVIKMAVISMLIDWDSMISLDKDLTSLLILPNLSASLLNSFLVITLITETWSKSKDFTDRVVKP